MICLFWILIGAGFAAWLWLEWGALFGARHNGAKPR